jgi:hypothetical protein
MKILQSFLVEVYENTKIHEIPIAELSSLLRLFFIRVRKADGSHYEPVSLRYDG